jgi:plasmid stabilization system protein ParE
MSEFVFHPEAVKDLDEIWEYIAADSLDAADQTIEEIYNHPIPCPVSLYWPQPT